MRPEPSDDPAIQLMEALSDVGATVVVSLHPAVSAFPERVVGSACASSFSRPAQRSLSLRPAHSRCHDTLIEGFSHFVALHDCSDCFRLERLPGGVRTHWKAPPCHGAHPKRTSGACCHLEIRTQKKPASTGRSGVGAGKRLLTSLLFYHQYRRSNRL